MTNTTMSGVKPTFNSFMDYTKLDRNRRRTVVFYGRVSTEHETQTNLAVKGRANSKERPYVYLYGEEADKTASDVHNICILNFDCLRRLLHRLQSTTNFKKLVA